MCSHICFDIFHINTNNQCLCFNHVWTMFKSPSLLTSWKNPWFIFVFVFVCWQQLSIFLPQCNWCSLHFLQIPDLQSNFILTNCSSLAWEALSRPVTHIGVICKSDFTKCPNDLEQCHRIIIIVIRPSGHSPFAGDIGIRCGVSKGVENGRLPCGSATPEMAIRLFQG
jgi:hypothetical protein